MSYYLYILKSEVKDTYYIGSSDDPVGRLSYHNSEHKGHTQRFRPWILVCQLQFETRREAMQAERKVKSWKSKRMIRRLIDKQIDIKDYL